MQGHSLSRIDRRLLRQRSSRGLELHIQSRTHLQQSTPRLHRSMARPTRSRTRNLSLGPLVQHKPPTPRPGRNHTATSRKPTHNNTKESGLTIPTQNPGLDNQWGLAAHGRVHAASRGARLPAWPPRLTPLRPKRRPPRPQHPDCQRFSPRWSALWAPHHLKP